MLTIEKLDAFGADTQTGLKRCVNKESIYLRLVGTVPGHKSFDGLKQAIEAGDWEAAFQEAHGLKGVVTNLSLTPLATPIIEITEHLREKEEIDYSGYLTEIMAQRDRLAALCD